VLNRPPKLLIADFGPTRLGVRLALADQDLEICAEADDAEQAIAGARLTQPDICFVGSELPGGGIAAVRGIQQAASGAAIVVLAGIGTASELLTAIRAGAIGYVPGTITREQLRRVLHAALAGEAVVPRSMVRTLIRELHTSAALLAGDVSGRQAQVLDLLRRGNSPAEIARRLEISPVTVRRHTSDLVRKLGLEDRWALVSFEPAIAANGGTRNGQSPTHANGAANGGTRHGPSPAHANGSANGGTRHGPSPAHSNGSANGGTRNGQSPTHSNGSANSGTRQRPTPAHSNGHAKLRRQ
jgi:DNA-binding NarL/FixJ family response regulator